MAANKVSQRSEYSALTIARVLWKDKAWVAAIVIVCGLISAVIVYALPAVYRAEAVILVESQKIPERYVYSTVNTEVQDRLATISQQILSTSRLLKVIDTFGLYKEERKRMVQEEVIEQMRKDIKITLEKGWTQNRPGAFRIGYEGRNPAIITEVTN